MEKYIKPYADLRDTNLRYAYLRNADLKGASLENADLKCANLVNADLIGANLKGANLKCAYLKGANLRDAYLRDAYLKGADLMNADLKCADLKGAVLMGANLMDADLMGANLMDAYLKGADLTGAVLRCAILETKEKYRKGEKIKESIIGWKKCYAEFGPSKCILVKLEIPRGAIVFGINGAKFRTDKAKVLEIIGAKRAYSHYKYFSYYPGDVIEVFNFNTEYNQECVEGIHFFKTREEAEKY